MSTELRSTIFRVGDYRIDPLADEISVDGSMIKLEPRCMSLLVCLAEHAGQVLSVEELLDAVWKDVVVNPDSVYQTVATLRRMLKDDARDPKYIANVVRRGYRLIATVVREGAPQVEVASPAPLPVASQSTPAVTAKFAVDTNSPRDSAKPKTLRRVPILIALVALCAGGALLAWYRVRLSQSTAPVRVATGALTVVAEHSVAVLPFLDLSEKKDEGYFADGISEELIDAIAREPQIRIPARTSSFYFKNRQATIAEIAKALRVTHLLEGSVRKSGDTLRITAQLIRADTGFHLWSQTYERPVADIFKVQDEIAEAVVRSLEVSLLQPRVPTAPPAVNPAAYTLYLKAKMLSVGASSDDYGSAVKVMQQALVLDPNFALGWAMLADMETADLDWHDNVDQTGHCARARRAVTEALRLDPRVADAHRALGNVYWHCGGTRDSAEAEYKRAIELDRSDMSSVRALAYLYTSTNRPRHALELTMRAAIADPLNPWAYVDIAFAQGTLGRLAEAEGEYRKALELRPSTEGLHALLANALLAEGRPQEALVENGKEADENFRMMNQSVILDALGRRDEAQAALDASMAKYPDNYNAAVFYGCRHDADRAIAHLRRMSKGSLLWDVPNRLACLKNLDDDPRFQALWKAQNLPPRDY